MPRGPGHRPPERSGTGPVRRDQPHPPRAPQRVRRPEGLAGPAPGGVEVGRGRVGRLMRTLGLAGATRTKRVRTTLPAAIASRPADLVERVFAAAAPNRLCVAELTYVWTRSRLLLRGLRRRRHLSGRRRLASDGRARRARSPRRRSPYRARRPPAGSTSGTPAGSTVPVATSRRPSSRPPIMPVRRRLSPPDSKRPSLYRTQGDAG